jgi:hypothetical protein
VSWFRNRRPAEALDLAALSYRLDAFEVPADDTERRRLAAIYQQGPSPDAGYRFWRLVAPDIEAAFWATRRANEGGSKR